MPRNTHATGERAVARASKFMDAKKIEAKKVVSASKKMGRKDAVALIKGANKVIVAKGRKVQSFPGGKASKEIVDALLGPTETCAPP